MQIKEQVIQKDGRIIRLAPLNMFREDQLPGLPVLRISPLEGFYIRSETGFEAVDVTTLWNRKHV